MKLDLPSLGTLYLAELRMLVRDRRTLITSVILPVLVLPLFFFASSFAEDRRQERIEALSFGYVVTGPEAELARALLREHEGKAAESEGDAPSGAAIALEERTVDDPRAALENRDAHVWIETLTAEEAEAARAEEAAAADNADDSEGDGEAEDGAAAEADEPGPPRPLLRLRYLADWDYSQTAMGELRGRFDEARSLRRIGLLEDAGLPVEVRQVAVVAERRDLATAGQRTGASLGRFATVFVLFFLFTGGSVVAADILAGEKERGTLETLLTTAAGRVEIVTAKMLVIFTVGAFITLVQLLNLWIYVGLEVIELPESFAVELSALAALCLFLLFLPLAALVAAVLLLVSGRSKTYKEFQIHFFPIILLGLLPACVSMLPGVELRSALALVPVANLAVAVREILVGELDWPMLAVTWITSAAAAVLVIRATLRALGTERLVTAADSDEADHLGGPALFPRHVLRWFAVMWAVIFLGVTNLQFLSSMQAQVLFNIVLVFFGASLLMIRRYRLDPKEALALRPVRPAVWLAVLIGAPSMMLVTITVARLGSWLFPIPKEMAEAFARNLLPGDVPLWQLLIFVALLPGVCEEVAFRGVLLHGLRKRFGPVGLCLAVGGIFAIFHFELIRLIPTGLLGVMLAAVTLLTGSLLPAILWHVLHNGMAVLATRQGLALEALPHWAYVAGFVAAALAFFLLWRHRTPYPDLRRRAPDLDL
ncbi:MAG: ABC transporter permease subunit [Acidobacteriota bacterium]